MPDSNYVLDLCVIGADLVTVPDYEDSIDMITVLNSYPQTIEINLSHYSTRDGVTYGAKAHYYDLTNHLRELIIYGVVEHATGSIGTELISGNELANRLWGDPDLAGPGGADTIHGGRGNDTVMGGAGEDVLSGGEDNDQLGGGAGNDLILGGSGRDTIIGGTGADTLDGGGDAGDLLSYVGSAAGVQVTLRADGFATLSGGDAQGDLVQGFRNLLGTGLADVLTDADKGALAGGANDNNFNGGGGADRLVLGGGNDTGLGGAGADVLYGEAGADLLSGGDGADRLFGGLGADVLTGGAGADLFVFQLRGESGPEAATRDRITDFNAVAGDRINLTALDADLGLTGNQAFHIVADGLTGQPGELALVTSGADILVLADQDGDGLADFALVLQGITRPGDEAFLL